MKKIIAIAVLAALVLSLAACSPINSAPVAVLWATDSEAISPNSLINAMDRALYIENISYTYYGAEGDAAKQLAQAEEALNAGCAVLMVEPVDAAAAAQFVELANAKQTPVIFFGANVDETVATESSLCLIVKTDAATLAEKYTEMLTEYLKDEKTVKNLDRNGDGMLGLVNDTGFGFVLEVDGVSFNLLDSDGQYNADVCELILTTSDSAARAILCQLQAQDFNTDKLATQYVALFTVGNECDYKAYVLDTLPEGGDTAAHYEANKFLVDLTTVEAEDMDKMIYTTMNVVESGRISGTVLEDYDAIAEAAAAACAAIIKNKSTETVKLVPYTIYAG